MNVPLPIDHSSSYSVSRMAIAPALAYTDACPVKASPAGREKMFKRILAGIVILVLAVYAFGFTQTAEIRTEIDIEAPPEKVWAVLTDFESYPDWNPFIRKIEGRAAVGETLSAEMYPLHMDSSQSFSPEVLVVDESKELRWLGKLLLPAIFDGEHIFRIEQTETGSRLMNGENFRGILLLAFDMDDFVPSFEAANEALKKRVEEAQ